MLVGISLHHCISLSVDDEGLPLGAYVNINLPPQPLANGWSWDDLELDWKLVVDYRRCWVPLLLDLPDFMAASLTPSQREIALIETSSVLRRVNQRVFPFDCVQTPYLGLELPAIQR